MNSSLKDSTILNALLEFNIFPTKNSKATWAINVELYATFSCSKINRIEKEGYLCKQVLFNGKTHVITTLETF